MNSQWFKRHGLQLALFLIAMGLTALVALQVVPREGMSTIVAALIAAAVALAINETVAERREREAKALAHEREAEAARRQREAEVKLREQREQAYVEVVEHLLSSFSGGSPVDEFHIRSKIAMWASVNFMEAYMSWRGATAALSGRGRVAVPAESKAAIEYSLARIALCARRDLEVEFDKAPAVENLIEVLFDESALSSRSAV